MDDQIKNFNHYLPVFNEYSNSTEYIEDITNRKEREILYQDLLSEKSLKEMTELEFGQVMSSLWASQMWGNKSYWVDNLLRDNDLEMIKSQLSLLLVGKGPIKNRYDHFRKKSKGFGTATITELLSFKDPEAYGIWNNKARKALSFLSAKDSIPFIKKSQLTGKEYEEYNKILKLISDELNDAGIVGVDLLGLNYYLFEVAKHPIKTDLDPDVIIEEKLLPLTPDDFDHDDVIEKLAAIGGWLGFEVEKEKHIAKGAKVDAVWQAKIANLGIVTYVFEVQRKGSIDSLILNLQKAQNNPSVQRLVVVAASNDISKIKGEIKSLPESFRKAVSFMEVSELIQASDLLSEFSEIIGKLDLVQSEFDYKKG